LFESVMSKMCSRYTGLRVISGYASASFLSRIIHKFPDLEIDLFLGMTSQGLSLDDHREFQRITKSNGNVKVYYQVKGKPNHMKIFEFSNMNDRSTWIGSANFSENGFFYQKEILVQLNDSLDALFEEQLDHSLICSDSKVNDLIEFFEREDAPDSNQTENNQSNHNHSNYRSVIRDSRGTARLQYTQLWWQKFRSRIDSNFYHSFEITVVLKNESNVHWDRTGINAWVEGKEPVLVQTPRKLFGKVFPEGEEFRIYTDDDVILEAKLGGKFNGELRVINLNLFDYIRSRIGMTEIRP